MPQVGRLVPKVLPSFLLSFAVFVRDPPVQSCRARERMLRLLRGALPQSSRYRLYIDRVTAAQGKHILAP